MEETSIAQELPAELMFRIMFNFDYRELVSTSIVCKRWYVNSKHDYLWRIQYRKMWGEGHTFEGDKTFLERFKLRYEVDFPSFLLLFLVYVPYKREKRFFSNELKRSDFKTIEDNNQIECQVKGVFMDQKENLFFCAGAYLCVSFPRNGKYYKAKLIEEDVRNFALFSKEGDDFIIAYFDFFSSIFFLKITPKHNSGDSDWIIISKVMTNGEEVELEEIFSIERVLLEDCFQDLNCIEVFSEGEGLMLAIGGMLFHFSISQKKEVCRSKYMNEKNHLNNEIRAICVFQDELVFAAGLNKTITAYHIDTLEESFHIKGTHKNRIYCMKVLESRQLLISSDSEGVVAIHSIETRQVLHKIKVESIPLCIHADNFKIFLGTRNDLGMFIETNRLVEGVSKKNTLKWNTAITCCSFTRDFIILGDWNANVSVLKL